MPGNFSIRICITTSEITDACIKAVEAVTTNTNSRGCLLICKMGILSTGTVRRIRFRHYGLPLIIQRCFSPGCTIARNVANIKTFCVVRRNIKKRFVTFIPLSSYISRVLKQELLGLRSTFDRQTTLRLISLFAKQDSFLVFHSSTYHTQCDTNSY